MGRKQIPRAVLGQAPAAPTSGDLDSFEVTDTLSPTRARRTTAPRNFVSADKVPPPTHDRAHHP